MKHVIKALVGILGASAFGMLPATAFASATLQVVQGSGEFQTLETTITVVNQTAVTLQWTTDQIGATGGTWVVTNPAARNAVIATGETGAAPSIGHFARFTLPANTFLKATPPASTVKYNLTVVPHDAANSAMGSVSPYVVVAQVPNSGSPVVFGPSAVFPKVEIISSDEQLGVVTGTQLYYAYADVKVRVSNSGTSATDPMWLQIKDNNLLMRQTSTAAAVGSLAAGASQIFTLHMEAILPPPTSQLPADQQYSQFFASYRNLCGMDLRSVLDWRGAQVDAPLNDHQENFLVQEGWSSYATKSPNAPICSGKQCVNACQIAKNIRAELDGSVTGYQFFAGQYPKWGFGGQARTTADGGKVNFDSKTKLSVGSVSKFVTAVAAVKLLDAKGISVDSAIGPYFPADWNVSTYVKNIKFSQLLTHTSGIKDYGNLAQTYSQLKSFFTQSIPAGVTTGCNGSNVQNPSNPINPNNLGGCYSNYNFAIFRVLLPKIAGMAEDANQGTRPTTLANQYVSLVQQNVFNPVGQFGVSCKPPAGTNYAFAHLFGNSRAGTDFGDETLVCGAASWYLSAEDLSKVLLSLNARDNKILPAVIGKDLFGTMLSRGFGWDVVSNGENEKNGAWGNNCDANGNNCNLNSTSVAVFGPVSGPRVLGVLFLNSNVGSGPSNGGNAKSVLEKAYNNAIYNIP